MSFNSGVIASRFVMFFLTAAAASGLMLQLVVSNILLNSKPTFERGGLTPKDHHGRGKVRGEGH
jgi:hypothetical protein